VAHQPKSGLGRLIVEVCRSHTDKIDRTSPHEWSACRRGLY